MGRRAQCPRREAKGASMSAHGKRVIDAVKERVDARMFGGLFSLDQITKETGLRRMAVKEALQDLCEDGSVVRAHPPGRPPTVWQRTAKRMHPHHNHGSAVSQVIGMRPETQFTFNELECRSIPAAQSAIRYARRQGLIQPLHTSQLYHRETPFRTTKTPSKTHKPR